MVRSANLAMAIKAPVLPALTAAPAAPVFTALIASSRVRYVESPATAAARHRQLAGVERSLRTATGRRAKLLRAQASRLAAGATAPPHASAVALLPAHNPREADRQRQIFALVGGRLGEVRL